MWGDARTRSDTVQGGAEDAGGEPALTKLVSQWRDRTLRPLESALGQARAGDVVKRGHD